MKAKSIIIAAIVLMAIVPTASAQEQIKKAFQEVTDELAGVTKVGEHNTEKVDTNGIAIESKVITVKVERRYQHSVSETLRDAFRNEASKTSMFEEEMSGEKLELDSALVHDLGLRRMWSIWRDEDDAVLIGSMKNSTYYIANFNDKKHKGYRTCYAAEWSNADNPEVYTVKLVYVYGQQPKTAHGIASVGPPNHFATVSMPDVLGKDIFKKQLEDAFGHQKEDIPFDGNKDSWMALALQRGVSNLSNTDWHRFFGLLTQQMMDKANKQSKEDMVVAAGIILDLCKNAPLDEDERKIVANRLYQVAECFDINEDSYIYDMLTLAARKVEKK
ncbi:MAG: hypothetical protein K6A93_07425 [Bacteroidaceae bacterium]|nr:hypothetical protein [Bacteroidaceae bacterium]